MSKLDSDRNLQVGILALQLSIIDEQQLLSGIKAWSFNKSGLLEDILLEQNAIDANTRQLLHKLACINVSASGSSQGFESVSTITTALKALSKTGDHDLQQSIADFLGTQSSHQAESRPTEAFRSAERSSRFRMLRPHAAGGLGLVSIAEDLELHREVAIKEIKPKYLNLPESKTRFLIEAEVTGRLEHPGIVPVYSLGETDRGGPFYAMQFIQGQSLSQAIWDLHSKESDLDVHSKGIELRKLVVRLVEVCNAIHYAHSKGVLHRDIKPQNIMLGRFGETFVVDWGLARVGNRNATNTASEESVLIPTGSGSSATQLGSAVGTIEYMSPEQADGQLDRLCFASDVFSLGATLYCILTGNPPTSSRPTEGRARLDYGNFIKPSKLNRAVPPALAAICMKSLESNSAARYQTANELKVDLESWLADEPVKAFPEPLSVRLRRWLQSHRTLAATILAAVATGMAGLVVLVVMVQEHNRELSRANTEIRQANATITESRDEAISTLKTARKLAINSLRTAEETLSQPQISSSKLFELRRLLTDDAFANYETWFKSYPDDRELAQEFAFTARVLSNLNRSRSNFGEARRLIEISLATQKLIEDGQRTNKDKLDLALTLIDKSELDFLEGKLNTALRLTSDCETLLKTYQTGEANEPQLLSANSTLHFQRARIHMSLCEFDSAVIESQASRTGYKALFDSGKTNLNESLLYMFSVLEECRAVEASGRRSEALVLADQAVITAKRYASVPAREFKYVLAMSLLLSAEYRITEDIQLDLAASRIKEALEIVEAEFPNGRSATLIQLHSLAMRHSGMLNRKRGHLGESIKLIKTAIQDAEALNSKLRTPEYQILLAESHFQLFLTHRQEGKIEAAQLSLEAASRIFSNAAAAYPEALMINHLLGKVHKASQDSPTDK